MSKYWQFPFLILFLLSPFTLSAQEKQPIDWDYEIDLLESELLKRHPHLFFRADSVRFYKKMDQVAREAPDLSLFETSVKLQQVVASLGDAHTRINYHFNVSPGSILPMECYWFSDGIYILKIRKEYEVLLGKRISSINGYPLAEVVDSLSTLIVDDNKALVKAESPRMITWTQLLTHFGFAEGDSVLLETMDLTGQSQKLQVKSFSREGESVSVEPGSLPLGWEDRKVFFRERYFEDDHLYYIQYNKCWSREVEEEYGTGASALFMPSFKEFEKQVKTTIRKKEIDKLVFDMRYNTGGNSSQGTGLIKELSKTKYHGGGMIYVLVGRHTFSSAIINTVDFLKYGDPIIVGEETGGRPNHYGEVKRFVLPESRLVVSYSTKYFTLLPEDVPTIIPDMLVTGTFEHFMKGIDPALSLIRSQTAH